MQVFGTFLALALLAGCASTTQEAPTPSPPHGEQRPPAAATEKPATPPDLKEQVAQSVAIGRQLYVLDKVAAVATDAVLAEVPDARSRGIAGYVPIQEADSDGRPISSFLVTFFTGDAPPRVAFEARVAPDVKPTVETFSPPKEMAAALVSLVRARQLAITSIGRPTQPLNPVLLPGAAIGKQGILVYLLAGTSKPDVAVFGKHFRALASDDGARLVEMTPLSNSVLEIPTRGPDGATPEGLAVTHLVTDFPLETHVFVSLLTKLPVFVATKRGVWRVQGDEIEFLGDRGPGAAPQGPSR